MKTNTSHSHTPSSPSLHSSTSTPTHPSIHPTTYSTIHQPIHPVTHPPHSSPTTYTTIHQPIHPVTHPPHSSPTHHPPTFPNSPPHPTSIDVKSFSLPPPSPFLGVSFACLLSQQHSSVSFWDKCVSLGLICSEQCMCCHTERTLEIKRLTSPSLSMLTLGRPVPALTLKRQGSHWSASFMSLV